MVTRGNVVMLCALALLTLGVVMVNSAGMSVAPVGETGQLAPGVDPVTFQSILTSRPSLYAVVAVVAMLVCGVLPTRWLERSAGLRPSHALAILAAALVTILALLLAVYAPGVGRSVNGAARWIVVPIAGSLQPSEIAKWGMVVVIACGAVASGDGLRRFRGGLPILIAVLCLVCAVIVVEDLGTAVLIGGVGVLVLVAAGMRLWWLLATVPVAVAGFVAAVLSSPYRVDRVVSFIDPYRDPQGDGYHMIQSMATIAGGGPFGRGLGHGLQKFGYLPEDTSDFLFAVICEELGLAGASLVIALYGVMFVALAGIVRAADGPVRRLIALGVLLTVAGQATINLFVVTGLGPTKGIALPLLSAGGTGWVLTCAALGLVAAIDRDTERRAVTLGGVREPVAA
ncbi:MAG: stage V sporulation protein E [Phycisphaerae bacterium]|nr:stage V sporulation protein E [Phycisphaerae bacterium]